MRKFLVKNGAYLFIFLGLGLAGCHREPQRSIVKVDFNMFGRKTAEVTQFGYTPWEVTSGGPDTLVEDGISFIVAAGSDRKLTATWYKVGVRGPEKAKFSDDGLELSSDEDSDKGAAKPEEIILKINGLKTGKHTLITYHNIIDDLKAGQQCPIDIYVDGQKKVDDLIPSIRASKITDSKAAVLQLDAKANKEVVVRFVADNKTADTYHKIVINGFQLDGINPADQAIAVAPVNRDEHVEADGKNGYVLKWQGTKAARSHDIYFGTDSMAVAGAEHGSPSYKGNQAGTQTSYAVSDLYSMDTYYWRIDEVTDAGIIKGNVWEFRTRQLAFSDAEGYGRFARGGRGGKVVFVTNLNDDGPGSLRAAVTNDIGPRTIIFNVGGVITLKSRLVLSQSNVTVAGQTAPGKGICIRSAPFGITGNDCIARFIRVRLGDGPTFDGMGLTGANNSIVDHCSISWTIDESFSSRGAHNITLQRTLISEALNAAGHDHYPKGKEHGFAATIGGDIGSFHHNLLADCYGRNWSLGGGLVDGHYGGRMDITNNVVYNWGHRATDGGAHEVNFVGNYYKPGAGTSFFYAYNAQHEGVGKGTQRCYFAGNVMPGHFDLSNEADGRKVSHSNGDTSSYATYVDKPFFPSYVTTQSAVDAYKNVLSDVGCNAPVLDEHDQRIIGETLAGTTSVVGSVTHKKGFPDKVADAGGYEDYPAVHRSESWDTDQDGMPDWWEILHGLDPKGSKGNLSESNGDPDKDGFTNLDGYLDWMAHKHYSTTQAAPLRIDLKELARGYSDAPTFKVTNVKGGSATVDHNGVLVYTPAAAAKQAAQSSLGGFDFTVTDREGSSMTRRVNVLIGFDLSK